MRTHYMSENLVIADLYKDKEDSKNLKEQKYKIV